jgi:hypothetical protein
VLLNACALLVIAAPAQTWQNKDWTQWTMYDCKSVLRNSPWAVQGTDSGHSNVVSPQDSSFIPVAQMSSSVVIRQALVRQAQLTEHYDKMSPQKQKAFDQKATTCLGNTYDDRFIVHIFFANVLGPLQLSVDGQKIHAHEPSKASISPCIDQAGTSIAFPRVVDGTPVVPLGAKELKVGDFTFDLQKMIYRGKLDF